MVKKYAEDRQPLKVPASKTDVKIRVSSYIMSHGGFLFFKVKKYDYNLWQRTFTGS
jgi:hypothetical protein